MAFGELVGLAVVGEQDPAAAEAGTRLMVDYMKLQSGPGATDEAIEHALKEQVQRGRRKAAFKMTTKVNIDNEEIMEEGRGG